MDPNPNDAMEQPLNDTEDSPEVDVNSVEKGSGGDSDESVRDEESLALSDEELDDFFKNAEHLSDQTLGGMYRICNLHINEPDVPLTHYSFNVIDIS